MPAPHSPPMLRLVCNLTLALIIGAVLLIFGAARLYPAIDGTIPVAIRGTSMEPTIPLSALVYVRPSPAYVVDDIVTFRTPGGLVTHRISGDWSGIGNGPWQTTGDGNDAPDAELVPTSAIIGKVESYLPLLGLALTLVTNPAVIGHLLILSVLLLYLPTDTRKPRPHTRQTTNG